MSGVRDLVFHKQEYRYCIDDLIEMFKLFNFQFLGCYSERYIRLLRKKFPYDKNKTELKNWDKFEEIILKFLVECINFGLKTIFLNHKLFFITKKGL